MSKPKEAVMTDREAYENDMRQEVKGWDKIPVEDRDSIMRYVLWLVRLHDKTFGKALETIQNRN